MARIARSDSSAGRSISFTGITTASFQPATGTGANRMYTSRSPIRLATKPLSRARIAEKAARAPVPREASASPSSLRLCAEIASPSASSNIA